MSEQIVQLGYVRTMDGYDLVISLTSSFDLITSKLFFLQILLQLLPALLFFLFYFILFYFFSVL
jgi:hypothetical protein